MTGRYLVAHGLGIRIHKSRNESFRGKNELIQLACISTPTATRLTNNNGSDVGKRRRIAKEQDTRRSNRELVQRTHHRVRR